MYIDIVFSQEMYILIRTIRLYPACSQFQIKESKQISVGINTRQEKTVSKQKQQ